MEIINAICPNCGAKINVDQSKDAAICEYCGSPYIVRKAIEKYDINNIYNTTNHINANVVNIVNHPSASQTTTEKIYLVKPQISEEFFKRKVLITLTSKNNTPQDIAKVKLSNVETSYITIVKYRANVDMNYTASVGYRQTENYVETTFRDGVQVVENRTRTKVVWSPISSSINEDYDGVASLENEKEVDYSDIFKLIPELSQEDLDLDTSNGPFYLDEDEVKRIKIRAENGVEFSVRLNLPGDEYKELRTSSKVVISDFSVYKVPYYELSYAYDGRVYKVACLALKESTLTMDTYPTIAPIQYVNKQADSLKKLSIASWVLWGIIATISFIVCSYTKYGLILGWIGLIGTLITGIISGFRSVRIFNDGIRGHNGDVVRNRIAALENGLANNELFPLTINETNSLEKLSYAESIKPRSKAGARTCTIIFSILTPFVILILMVISLG